MTLGFAEGEALQAATTTELEDKGVQIHLWPDEILDTLESNLAGGGPGRSPAEASFRAA